MKKRLFLTLFFVAFTLLRVMSQTPQWQWAKSASANAWATAVCTDSLGYIYITGYFSGTLTLGNNVLVGNQFDTEDIFLAKYDRIGNVLWAKKAGGQGRDFTRSINADNLGRIVIAGRTNSPSISFGSVTSYNPQTMLQDTSANGFVAVYDSSGQVQWAKTFGATKFDYTTDAKFDNHGNIWTTGLYSSDSILLGSYVLYNNDNLIYPGYKGPFAFLCKYDAGGNVISVNHASTLTQWDYGVDEVKLTIDHAGNVIQCGHFGGRLIFDTDTTLNDGMFIAKYDTQGNKMWIKSIADGDRIYSCVDKDNDIYLAGDFYGHGITIGNTVLPNAAPSSGNSDLFLAKCDTNGNPIWAERFGGIGHESISAICPGVDGQIYITGDIFHDTFYWNADPISSPGSLFTNVFVAKCDTDGIPVWAITSSATDSNDYENIAGSSGLALDDEDNAYITGGINSSYLRFGSTTITNPYYHSVFFLAKIEYGFANGVEESSNNNRRVYPNPSFNGKVMFSGLQMGETIKIYDMLGQLVKSVSTSEESYLLDVSDKGKGMYIYRISDGAQKSCQGKLLIN